MDMVRQSGYFNPQKHKRTSVDIIGLGAVGSYVSWFLSKTGMENLNLWDNDFVEEHNIPNQCFLEEHTGKQKVEAAKEMTRLGSGFSPNTNQKKITKGEVFKFGKIVFLLVDSMAARKEIWEEHLKYKLTTELVIETRMGMDNCRVYAINPCNQRHINRWEETLYSDEESSESLCGAVGSIVSMASLTATIAITQAIKWLNGGDVENEVIISTDPEFQLILNHY